MKFWLLAILGAAGLTFGSTWLTTNNPNMKRPASSAAAAKKAPEGPQPRVQAAGVFEVTHTKMPQHHKGIDHFEVKNSGARTLHLEAGKASCVCTDLYFSAKPDKLEDPAPAEGDRRVIDVEPGETAYVVARWDTKNKGGRIGVSAKVYTNDPITPELLVKVNLDIEQALTMSKEALNFPGIDQGVIAKQGLECFAPLSEQIEVSGLEVSAPYLSAKAEELGPEELLSVGAKSGVRIVVAAGTDAPSGRFAETLRFKVKVGDHTEEKSVPVSGVVHGMLQILGDSKIDFVVASAQKGSTMTRGLFAKREPPGGDYKLGAVTPENAIAATLERKGTSLNWTLKVSLKPGAPAGGIKAGKVTITDGAGKEAAAFVVMGVVNG
jgi:hypothetical protein